MNKICCCTGHRPKGFPFKYGTDLKKHNEYLNALEEKIKLAITDYGVTNFISGMALGVDLDFAEIVLKLRDKYPITLECAIPDVNQTLKWNDKDKQRYTALLERADEKHYISGRNAWGHPWIKIQYSIEELARNLLHGNFGVVAKALTRRVRKWTGKEKHV